jgi:catalase
MSLSKCIKSQTECVFPSELPLSPILQLIGKMKNMLLGRCVGATMHEGSNAAAINAVCGAVEAAVRCAIVIWSNA